MRADHEPSVGCFNGYVGVANRKQVNHKSVLRWEEVTVSGLSWRWRQ